MRQKGDVLNKKWSITVISVVEWKPQSLPLLEIQLHSTKVAVFSHGCAAEAPRMTSSRIIPQCEALSSNAITQMRNRLSIRSPNGSSSETVPNSPCQHSSLSSLPSSWQRHQEPSRGCTMQ